MGTDVLIVGAGSAGCVLARRLSTTPDRHVTIIEAGGLVTDPDVARPAAWPLLPGRDFDWAYSTSPQPGLNGRSLVWPRGRGLGGSSNLHAMAHVRGDAADFAPWVEATRDDRWSWDRLLPHYRTLERFSDEEHGPHGSEWHGHDGPLPVLLPGEESLSPLVADYLSAWQSLGLSRLLDHNHGHLVGATANSLTIADGARVTAHDAYLAPVRDRANLMVLPRTTAHRLHLQHGRVRGLDVSHDGAIETIEADTVILAAGSLGDPLLLMRSGIGEPRALGDVGVRTVHALPGVGRELHDHLLGAGVLYRSRQSVPPSRLQVSEAMSYLPADGPGTTNQRPDVVVGCVVAPSVSEVYRPALAGLDDGGAYTLLFGVTNPTSRGHVNIGGPDIDDAPIIDPGYLRTEHDRRLFRRALELARRVGEARELAPWRAGEILPGPSVHDVDSVDAFIARAAITHHHPVGTCHMGTDVDAVVDPGLRIRGIDNLYVVDASIFPSITSGPVHATVLAVAESFASTFSD